MDCSIPYFESWRPARLILPRNHILSSDWGGIRGRKEMFYPTYCYERYPDMYKLVTFEYARIWQEERLQWDNDTERSDPKLLRAKEWKAKFDQNRLAEKKRRAEVRAKQIAETKIKEEQKAAEAKKMLEAKAAALKKKKEDEATERERKRLAQAAQKKKAELLANPKLRRKERPKGKEGLQNSPVNDPKCEVADEYEKEEQSNEVIPTTSEEMKENETCHIESNGSS